jgi:ribonuclease Z
MVPTIGIRVECKPTQKIFAYSCDTEPCEQTVRLADGADILIHEAGGATYGHSSAEQAGEIATRAEVGKLYLIHYPTGRFAKGDLAAEARKTYQGDITIAKDFMTIEI